MSFVILVFQQPWNGLAHQWKTGMAFQLDVVAVMVRGIVPFPSRGGFQALVSCHPGTTPPQQRGHRRRQGALSKGLGDKASVGLQGQPLIGVRPEGSAAAQQSFQSPTQVHKVSGPVVDAMAECPRSDRN